MHQLEQRLVEALAQGRDVTLADFSLEELLASAPILGASPFVSEFVKLALVELRSASPDDSSMLEAFLRSCLQSASDDLAWMELVDILDENTPLPARLDGVCFDRFLSFISDRHEAATLRSVGLDGALRWATSSRRRQLRLLDVLLGIEPTDDAVFLSRAAKIIGVAYSYWREPELIDRLRQLATVPGVSDEASFELGMASLIDGFEASERRFAGASYETAKHWFRQTIDSREHRPDADVYLACLSVILDFSTGHPADALEEPLDVISRNAFASQAWHHSEEDPPWLGARHAEAICWAALAMRLGELSKHLDEAAWWQPAAVVEDCLLAAYGANRSILRRSADGGVTSLVRPRIEANLAQHEWQAHLLREWLRRNPQHDLAAEGTTLIRRIDELISESFSDPQSAAKEGPSLAALIDQAGPSSDSRRRILDVILNAHLVQFANLTDAEVLVIEKVRETASTNDDYRTSAAGHVLFDAVLYGSVRFLHSRLEMTKRHDPGVEYLFEREDGSLPLEAELQSDYHRFMYNAIPGGEIEISNIGGGRVDVRFVYRAERIITEIKREGTDCTFENLRRIYGGQSTDYQNVSVRLGFLLVLDQCEIRTEGTPHITELIHTTTVIRTAESVSRHIVIIKVPGRRVVPSELSKIAKCKKAGSRTRGRSSKQEG
jgi:hypothetical protein